jgi:hypothetical protein
MINLENFPMWEHDCEHCTFLGTFDNHDLYFCAQCIPGDTIPTVIARYGSNPQDCQSGMWFGEFPLTHENVNIHLRVAYMIAKDLCLIETDIETKGNYKVINARKGQDGLWRPKV